MRPGLVASILFLAATASASDGILEIGQTCAIDGSCLAMDPAGFPVTIAQPGSYVLTSNLTVADPNLDAIEITASGVTLDLNGFEVVGPVDCSSFGSLISCSPSGTGTGIDASSVTRFVLRNGNVKGFALHGVSTGDRARLDGLRVDLNGTTGILTGTGSAITNSHVRVNQGIGISAGEATLVTEATVESNKSFGVFSSWSVSVSDSDIHHNGGAGLFLGPGSSAERVRAFQNEGDGIVVGPGSLVSECNSDTNGRHGIFGVTTAVNGSRVRGNWGWGISLFLDGAYRENTLLGNGAGDVSGGIDGGDNLCNGNFCP